MNLSEYTRKKIPSKVDFGPSLEFPLRNPFFLLTNPVLGKKVRGEKISVTGTWHQSKVG